MDPLLNWLVATMARAMLETMSTPEAAAVAPSGDALHEPVVITHDSDDGETLLAGVRTTLDEELSRSDRTRLGKKVLSPARVQLAAGTFPGEGTAVVTVNVPMRAKDPTAPPRFISGVFTLTADGTLATIVIAPKLQPDRFELAALGDTDGDGHDDLALAVHGPTGESQRLVTWNDGAPTSSGR